MSVERLIILGLVVVLVGAAAVPWLRENLGLASRPADSSLSRVEAPEFTLAGLDGQMVRLSHYRGKVVLLNFWATWCPPCQAEMPELEALHRTHQNGDLVILALDQRERPDIVRSYVTQRQLTVTILLDQSGETSASYGVYGLPTSVLVDRNGRVAHTWVGAVTRKAVETRLAALGPRG